ncbi:MAG TPA: hypothetical protein VN256_05015 [Pyrinomonadaceae bacterium]|nr:hypothetical protein [Pyrinomonadaceae bacterium]
MLLLASRILEHELNQEGRLRLLEKLQERGFTPLIRSARRSCFEQALDDALQVEEMERLIAASADSDAQAPYVRGDIFCFSDHVFFLLFGGREHGAAAGMRAGIVYEARTAEPLRKLNSFCQAVTLCVGEADAGGGGGEGEEGATALALWRQDWPAIQDGFVRFVVKQDPDILSAVACRENSRERVRAAKLLEDSETRDFLRRAKEAYAEGYPVTASADAAGLPGFAADKLSEAGLLRREVLVSCRKSGHTLFSLPSADALAVVTISQARCSECGTSIADEKVEEVLAPTQFSHMLLEDGAWLVNRLHSILRELGIAESEIAVEPPAGDGEARMMARVCDESFLIVMRDGDLTPAFARRAINTKLETDARHLLIVATGKIHNEGRTSLLGFASRTERGGNDFELIIADGAEAAAAELRRAFERVSHKALAEQLCELDASMGLSVSNLIETRFRMLDNAEAHATQAQLRAPAARERELEDVSPVVPVIDLSVLESAER